MSEVRAAALNAVFPTLDIAGRLARLVEDAGGPVVFTTSLGLEDQVLTHIIAVQSLNISLVSLDTGRLFPETYDLWTTTEERYGRRIAGFHPRHDALEALTARQGVNGFYRSVEARKTCCGVRKVEPLGRALAFAAAWMTGLRADQSTNRSDLRSVEWDQSRRLLKANPLLDWSREDAAAFAASRGVPTNPLHARSFLSIGCAPCTRAIRAGEPERAGRWWWEEETKKECGLHIGADGRVARAAAHSAKGSAP